MTLYCVHARDEEVARPHRVQAQGHVDAALAYAERWLGQTHGDVTLLVEDESTGREHCLTLDLDSGEATACG